MISIKINSNKNVLFDIDILKLKHQQIIHQILIYISNKIIKIETPTMK